MKISYPVAGIVSVWVGNFPSEMDFDKCVDGPISDALNIEPPLASICEVSFQDEAVSIRKIIEGFSGWESFVEQAERAASINGVGNVNAALVCYYVQCEGAPDKWAKMNFLGSFDRTPRANK